MAAVQFPPAAQPGGHVGPPEHALSPLQSVTHAHAPAQSIAEAHVPIALHVAEHFPAPHLILP